MTQWDLTAYVGAFVDELSRAGVRQVVISPGSRSTPLALVLSEHPDINVWLQVDERSAAFFALGIAKASQEPVAVVCTSGTAAANYFPAIIEAKESRIPLIILTADRPHELRNVGAPQAIDQIQLYGSQVKWYQEMAVPSAEEDMIRYARNNAVRAVVNARTGQKGPVHLNFPFQEPLIPDMNSEQMFTVGRIERATNLHHETGQRRLASGAVQNLWEKLKGSKGLIVCGPNQNHQLKEALVRLSEALSFPILADPLSQLRSGQPVSENIIETYDALLKDKRVREQLKPEVMIRFGAMPVSKPYLFLVKESQGCTHIVVDEQEGWREPTHTATDMLFVDEHSLCDDLLLCAQKDSNDVKQDSWLNLWTSLNKTARAFLKENLHTEEMFEGKVLGEVIQLTPNHSNVFVGNSMPVRDLDSFYFLTEKNIDTYANRGANGIDGVVSSALGTSINGKPTTLVIGDLSFFHDMNGLLLAKLNKLNMTVVLINNDGGGIFSFLPQADQPKHFESLFGTPIGLNYEKAVELFEGSFTSVGNWEDFRQAYQKAQTGDGLSVIEVKTERERNALLHREIWNELATIILSDLKGNRL